MALIIALGVVALVALVLVCVFLMMKVLTQASGLNALAAAYPATEIPAGEVRARQTAMVGAVRWRNCVLTVVAREGFFLDTRFGARPAMIPWDQFRGATRAMVNWRPAVRLSVGDPQIGTITVLEPLYGLMQPHLPASARSPQ